jgi:hypothetical protein
LNAFLKKQITAFKPISLDRERDRTDYEADKKLRDKMKLNIYLTTLLALVCLAVLSPALGNDQSSTVGVDGSGGSGSSVNVGVSEYSDAGSYSSQSSMIGISSMSECGPSTVSATADLSATARNDVNQFNGMEIYNSAGGPATTLTSQTNEAAARTVNQGTIIEASTTGTRALGSAYQSDVAMGKNIRQDEVTCTDVNGLFGARNEAYHDELAVVPSSRGVSVQTVYGSDSSSTIFRKATTVDDTNQIGVGSNHVVFIQGNEQYPSAFSMFGKSEISDSVNQNII